MELHRSASETQKFGSIKRATKSQNYQLELRSGRKQRHKKKLLLRPFVMGIISDSTVFVVVDIYTKNVGYVTFISR